jgi:hypothetical protein
MLGLLKITSYSKLKSIRLIDIMGALFFDGEEHG